MYLELYYSVFYTHCLHETIDTGHQMVWLGADRSIGQTSPAFFSSF